MRTEGNDFIMEGRLKDDPDRIQSPAQLTKVINELGFLPLFKNTITGFSVEEMCSSDGWWTGNPMEDPWEWRGILAREGIVSYGKVFAKKAGFISQEWYPVFANYRRDGYDFDSRYEDGLAGQMDFAIMKAFEQKESLTSFELKAMIVGKSRKGTGFDTALTRLQMQTYLTVEDFRRKRKKTGEEYGWAAAVFTMPEMLFGGECIQKEYSTDPLESKKKIVEHMRIQYPNASEKEIEQLIR